MKKINKKYIIPFIIGAIFSCSITGVIAYTFNASQITYKPKNDKWNITNVEEAINNLRITLNKNVCKLISGNPLEIGSKYECNPSLDGTTKYNFYILNVTNDTVKLIMERNISDFVGNSKTMNWQTAMNFFRNGAGTTLNWKVDVDLPEAQDIADAVGFTSWNLGEKNADNGWFCLASKTQESQVDPWCGNQSAQNYLFDYTRDCNLRGCTNSLDSNYAHGYWTRDLISKTAQTNWVVGWGGALGTLGYTTSDYGVRPVITISKSNLRN